MTRHAHVAASAEVGKAIPALAALAAGIGDPQVRHRGTIGGSIANATRPRTIRRRCSASARRSSPTKREIAAGDFFTGLFQTALASDEIVNRRHGSPSRTWRATPSSGSRPRATPSSACWSHGPAPGSRSPSPGRGPRVFRSREVEEALAADFSPGALAAVSVDPAGLNSDIHADAEYRAHLIVAMARRAVVSALAGAA
jgi:carbon-monoxide dehydrogenase medium subunit